MIIIELHDEGIECPNSSMKLNISLITVTMDTILVRVGEITPIIAIGTVHHNCSRHVLTPKWYHYNIYGLHFNTDRIDRNK